MEGGAEVGRGRGPEAWEPGTEATSYWSPSLLVYRWGWGRQSLRADWNRGPMTICFLGASLDALKHGSHAPVTK